MIRGWIRFLRQYREIRKQIARSEFFDPAYPTHQMLQIMLAKAWSENQKLNDRISEMLHVEGVMGEGHYKNRVRRLLQLIEEKKEELICENCGFDFEKKRVVKK